MEYLNIKPAVEAVKGVTSFVMNRLVYLEGWAGHSVIVKPANIQIFEDLPTHERVNFGQIPGPSMKTKSKDGGV